MPVRAQADAILVRGELSTPPSGVRVVDATGKIVIPGMIDNHSHIGGELVYTK